MNRIIFLIRFVPLIVSLVVFAFDLMRSKRTFALPENNIIEITTRVSDFNLVSLFVLDRRAFSSAL